MKYLVQGVTKLIVLSFVILGFGSLAKADVVKLSQPVPPNSAVNVAFFALNNTHVVYLLTTNITMTPNNQIYSVPVTGGTPVNLSQLAGNHFIPDTLVKVSPDGTRAFYVTDATVAGRFDLYSAPVDGSTPPVQVSSINVNGGFVDAFQITADGSTVFYIADQDALNVKRLYRAPTTQSGSSSIISIGNLIGTSDVSSFELTPDESEIVFEANPLLPVNNNEIMKVPVSGGVATSLSGPPAVGGGNSAATFFNVSPNGSRVAFRTDRLTPTTNEVFSVSINGTPADVIKLSGPLAPQQDAGFSELTFSADGNRILYISQESFQGNLGGDRNLFHVASDNPADKRQVNPTLDSSNKQVLDWAWNRKGDRIIYLSDQVQANIFRLYSTRVNGGNIISLNDAFIVNGYVREFQVVPNGRAVLYTANKESAGKVELYFVPVRGGQNIKISDPIIPPPDINIGVNRFVMSSDSRYVAYTSTQEDATKLELYITEIPIVRDATADFDGDFVNDILLKKGRSLRILTRNNPTNTFVFRDFLTLAPKRHKILAAKDLNDDNRPEIIFKKGRKKPAFAMTVTTNLILTNMGVQLPVMDKKFKKIRASGFIDTNTVIVATKKKIMRLYFTPFGAGTNNPSTTNNFIERVNPKGFKVVGFGSFNEEPAIILRGSKKQKKQFSAITIINSATNTYAFGPIITNIGTLPKRFKPFAAAPFIEEINPDIDVVIRRGRKHLQLLDLLPNGSTNTYPVKTLIKKERKYKVFGPK